MTQRHDSAPITIVGGSATGLFAADRLARAGRPVTLLESADDWSPEPRTLIVTRRMRDLLGEVGDRSIVNTISRFELVTAGRTASVALSEPDLIIERAVLVPGSPNARWRLVWTCSWGAGCQVSLPPTRVSRWRSAVGERLRNEKPRRWSEQTAPLVALPVRPVGLH